MAQIRFTQNIQRHVECPPDSTSGSTVREVLDAYFIGYPRARAYVLDEHGALRKHMVVFVDGRGLVDRDTLSDPVAPDGLIDVIQALSGG